jgi:hypothetical protein
VHLGDDRMSEHAVQQSLAAYYVVACAEAASNLSKCVAPVLRASVGGGQAGERRCPSAAGGGSGQKLGLEGVRAKRVRRKCSSAAEAGKTWGWRGHARSECEGSAPLRRKRAASLGGCRGETPRTPPAAGEVPPVAHVLGRT